MPHCGGCAGTLLDRNGRSIYELSLIHIYELMAVLDTCTEAQRRRFLLYALDGLSLAEIGVLCSCSKVAVYQSCLLYTS